MRAFFYRTVDGLQWRIATLADKQKPGHFLTVLNTPTNADDAAMLQVIQQRNPSVEHITYTELVNDE